MAFKTRKNFLVTRVTLVSGTWFYIRPLTYCARRGILNRGYEPLVDQSKYNFNLYRKLYKRRN